MANCLSKTVELIHTGTQQRLATAVGAAAALPSPSPARTLEETESSHTDDSTGTCSKRKVLELVAKATASCAVFPIVSQTDCMERRNAALQAIRECSPLQLLVPTAARAIESIESAEEAEKVDLCTAQQIVKLRTIIMTPCPEAIIDSSKDCHTMLKDAQRQVNLCIAA